MPKSFVENYQHIKNKVLSNNYPLPKRVKTIFTSNSFGIDDYHNIWIAEKFKWIKVGQHGRRFRKL